MRRGKVGFGRCLVVLVGLLLTACGTTSSAPEGPKPLGHYKLGTPYQVAGRWYYPSYDPGYTAVGVASWYGYPFHGRATANGELFDRDKPSAAHPTLPLPSIVRVTNLANQRQIELRVNDRGPFIGDRLIDLSQAAARALDFEQHGLAEVRVEFLSLADDAGGTPPTPSVPVVRLAAQQAGEAPRATPAVASPPADAPRVDGVRQVAIAAGGSAAERPGGGRRCRALRGLHSGRRIRRSRAGRAARQGARRRRRRCLPAPSFPRSTATRACGSVRSPSRARPRRRCAGCIGSAMPTRFLVKPDAASSLAC